MQELQDTLEQIIPNVVSIQPKEEYVGIYIPSLEYQSLFDKWKPMCTKKKNLHFKAYLYYMRINRVTKFCTNALSIFASIASIITFVLSNTNIFAKNDSWNEYLNFALISATMMFSLPCAFFVTVSNVMNITSSMEHNAAAHRLFLLLESQIELIQLSKQPINEDIAKHIIYTLIKLQDQVQYRIPSLVKCCNK